MLDWNMVLAASSSQKDHSTDPSALFPSSGPSPPQVLMDTASHWAEAQLAEEACALRQQVLVLLPHKWLSVLLLEVHRTFIDANSRARASSPIVIMCDCICCASSISPSGLPGGLSFSLSFLLFFFVLNLNYTLIYLVSQIRVQFLYFRKSSKPMDLTVWKRKPFSAQKRPPALTG